jgi:hypothetical protein
MIDWLISVGRGLVVFCAFLTILACAIQGYFLASVYDQTIMLGNSTVAAGPFFGVILGAVVGLLIAGAVFGFIAAVFDMQRSLRRLVDRLPSVDTPAANWRREPSPPAFTPPVPVVAPAAQPGFRDPLS